MGEKYVCIMKFQQRFRFNKSLSLHLFVKILIDPVLIISTLFFLVIYFEGKLSSPYIVLSVILFALSFPGAWVNTKKFGQDVINTANQWLLIIGLLFFFGYATGYLYQFSHRVISIWVLVTPLILIVAHYFVNLYFSSLHYIAQVKKTAVIVGLNELGNQLESKLSEHAELAIDFKGYFDVSSTSAALTLTPNNRLLGTVAQLPAYVKKHGIEVIYIALPPSLHDEIIILLDDLKDTTSSIYFVPNFFIADLIQARIDEIGGMPIVAVCETPFSGFNGLIKRVSDLVAASLVVCLILPILIILAFGVKLSSPGPIIFKQRRYGLDGNEIVVYKFRSMTVTEDDNLVKQATKGDKRVTKFGQFIRKTSLDELPQFINVLQGRMSIVGPRPHAVSHNEMYRKLIKGYMVRHKVKPGITGWAQVNGFRGETASVESMKSRIDYDIEYLKTWSLGLDLKIVLLTVSLIFKDSQAY